MELDNYKIGECLRTYSKVFSKINSCKDSLDIDYEENTDCIYDIFHDLVINGETDLDVGDYQAMLAVKTYVSLAHMLFYNKDLFIKGLNDVDFKDKDAFIDLSSSTNKFCVENFKDVDIINYVRNALAHDKNDLYSFYYDENQRKISISLKETIASKGAKKGQTVPFEVEFNMEYLLGMAKFCSALSNRFYIGGVNVKKSVLKSSINLSFFSRIKEVINSAYYTYTLFDSLSLKNKKKVMDISFNGDKYSEHNSEIIGKFRKKDHTKKLSPIQKACILYNISNTIKNSAFMSLETYDSILKGFTKDKAERLDSFKVKNASAGELKKQEFSLWELFRDNFEYEALKTIPLGVERQNAHLASVFLNSCFSRGVPLYDARIQLNSELLFEEGPSYEIFSSLINPDKEEVNMFLKTLHDSKYLEHESLSLYYRHIFENFVDENEIIKIGNVEIEPKHIRNAFTHGRWYFDDRTNSWELFDGDKKSVGKYDFNWHKSLSADSLHEYVESKFTEAKLSVRNHSI